MRKATIFDCPCGQSHVLFFEDIPNPYLTYRYRCPRANKFRETNGFQITEACAKKSRKELIAKVVVH